MNVAPVSTSTTTFKPIDLLSSTDNTTCSSSSSSSCSLQEEPLLSPLAIFRDGENGATAGMHLMQRANPIDSMMDCSNNDDDSSDTTRFTSHEDDDEDDDLAWTESHQRVISPFPDGCAPDHDIQHVHPLPHTDSWNHKSSMMMTTTTTTMMMPVLDFSHFFPTATAVHMDIEGQEQQQGCVDDFSLSSVDEGEMMEDYLGVLLAHDLTSNPERFWESANQYLTDHDDGDEDDDATNNDTSTSSSSNNSRSHSPAQVSIGSSVGGGTTTTTTTTTALTLFPPSPTSTTEMHEFVDLSKTRVLPC